MKNVHIFQERKKDLRRNRAKGKQKATKIDFNTSTSVITLYVSYPKPTILVRFEKRFRFVQVISFR